MFEFTDATREQAKARIALAGPSGSGKSYTALMLATELVDAQTIAEGRERIAAVDTERGTLKKYTATKGNENRHYSEAGGFGYRSIEAVRFNPLDLIEIVGKAEKGGYGALVIDTGSAYWNGIDGMLAQVDAEQKRSNTRDAWKVVGERYEKPMFDALLSFSGHLIFTMRTKVAHVAEEYEDDRGRKKTRMTKIGLAPVQREGIEHEFDIVGDIDIAHTLRITKTRCSALDEAVINRPGPELAKQLLKWLAEGEAPKFVDWNAELAKATLGTLSDLWGRAERAGKASLLRSAFTERKHALNAVGHVNGTEVDA